MDEKVVLVDEADNVIGTMLKETVHQLETPLHRAFSLFIFNHNKELLIQQRSHKKLTWPLSWSNSCCGHPLPGESDHAAITRRVANELGARVNKIAFMSPYRYRFTRDNITENEICPIYVAILASDIILNPDEVETVQWLDWQRWLMEIQNNSDKYSEWCIEESLILANSAKFAQYLASL